eukprot:1832520-Amphidinium_carterae.1
MEQIHARPPRSFACEQPRSSKLWHLHPWPQVLAESEVMAIHFDQCTMGQHYQNVPAKKPSTIVTDAPEIAFLFEVRGFRDHDADWLQAYATTASRTSQRLLVSLAVTMAAQHPEEQWTLRAFDIQKAFLQGISYSELSEMTNEPLRNIGFEVPPGTAEMVRKLPGFETFDEATEILHLDRPGTGLKDAPRAFSLKLRRLTTSMNFVQSCIDRELEF